jgi:hypothetical protein
MNVNFNVLFQNSKILIVALFFRYMILATFVTDMLMEGQCESNAVHDFNLISYNQFLEVNARGM